MDEHLTQVEKALLVKRAAELAQTQSDEELAGESLQVLQFQLGETLYSVTLEDVEAVMRIGDILTVPLVPPHCRGIIRRRGASLVLISLRHFFFPESKGIADADFAVVVQVAGKRFCLQVEDILGVYSLGRDDIGRVPDNFDPSVAPYVSGVTTERLVLLDLGKLMASEIFRMGSEIEQK